MKFYLLLVYLTVGLAAFYYFTVFFHIFFNIFGDKVKANKAFIPFYGWIVGLRPEKKPKVEEPVAEEKKPKQSKKPITRKPRAKKSEEKKDTEETL